MAEPFLSEIRIMSFAFAPRGWALCKALVCLIIGDDGVNGRPGGKATWGPPARAALERLAGARP